MAIFGIALVVGIGYAATQLLSDLAQVHPTSYLPFILLGIVLPLMLATGTWTVVQLRERPVETARKEQ